jgi:hypothetical protein
MKLPNSKVQRQQMNLATPQATFDRPLPQRVGRLAIY